MPPNLDVKHSFDRLAARQFGLLTRPQLLRRVSGRTVDRWRSEGSLLEIHRGVYRCHGTPVTDEQRLLAAVFAAGPTALASHRSAAWLWGILPSRVLPIEPEITVPATRRPRLHGVIVHRSLDLYAEPPSRRGVIPATNPLVAILHLGAVVGDDTVEDAIDLGLERRLFSLSALRALHGRFGKSGRDGAGALWRVLDQRALGDARADGLLEPRMARLLRDHGLPAAAFQHPVVVNGRRYPIDFAYAHQMIAIEVDGYESHASRRARQRDLDRQNDLVDAGWTVLRFTWADVVRRPDLVARRIASVLARTA